MGSPKRFWKKAGDEGEGYSGSKSVYLICIRFGIYVIYPKERVCYL